MSYDVATIRKRLRQSQAGKFADPDEFRPDKAQSTTEPTKYRFFVLPPIHAGDKLTKGIVPENQDMSQFFIAHASHWIDNKPYACPRVWDNSDCDLCTAGFDLLKEEKNEEKRKAIISQWMPGTYYAVNIYFPNMKTNPEDLRDKVKFFNGPKTCFDVWAAALMRDDAGDPDDPQAFGVFFDENAAFLYQLEVLKQGKNNSYKTSKFLVDCGAGKGVPVPMKRLPDGSPDVPGLERILRQRHNLFEKIEKPDPAKIKQLCRILLDGGDLSDAGNEAGGFDSDEQAAAKPAVKTEAKAGAGSVKVSNPVKAKKVESVDDDLLAEAPLPSPAEDLEEAPPAKAPAAAKPKAAATKAPEKAPVAVAAGNGDDEIDALLSQLDDEA